MATNFTGGTNSFKREFFDRPTKHGTHEIVKGDRYSPWIQIRFGEGALRVAPYLPFDRIIKDYYTYTVMRAFTISSVDQSGYLVPANGILAVGDGTDFYDARPHVYAAHDYDSSAFGDWPDTDAPINVNPFDGGLLEVADVNAEGVCEAAVSTDPTGPGIAGMTFAGVKSGSMPIGLCTDELVEGASRFNVNEWDPQESVTIQTMYTLAVPEASVNRYNYGQATRQAILDRNNLVGDGTVAALANVGTGTGATELAGLPEWATQGDVTKAGVTGNDMIRGGDVVSCDSKGNMVRFDTRVDDWNIQGSPGTPTDLEINGRYPVAAVAAIVGRCHGRQAVVASTPLSKVKTYQSQLLGGSGTGGIEAWMLRGDVMTTAERTSIIATGKPETGATDNYSALDAVVSSRYALLVHLTMM